MSFTLLESGKDHNVNASFVMTANTELSLVYTLPDNTVVTKTSADGVVLGPGNITDPDTGQVFVANEYVIYPIEVGFLSQAGTWSVYIVYDNTGSTPPDKFIGKCSNFTVLDPTVCT